MLSHSAASAQSLPSIPEHENFYKKCYQDLSAALRRLYVPKNSSYHFQGGVTISQENINKLQPYIDLKEFDDIAITYNRGYKRAFYFLVKRCLALSAATKSTLIICKGETDKELAKAVWGRSHKTIDESIEISHRSFFLLCAQEIKRPFSKCNVDHLIEDFLADPTNNADQFGWKTAREIYQEHSRNAFYLFKDNYPGKSCSEDLVEYLDCVRIKQNKPPRSSDEASVISHGDYLTHQLDRANPTDPIFYDAFLELLAVHSSESALTTNLRQHNLDLIKAVNSIYCDIAHDDKQQDKKRELKQFVIDLAAYETQAQLLQNEFNQLPSLLHSSELDLFYAKIKTHTEQEANLRLTMKKLFVTNAPSNAGRIALAAGVAILGILAISALLIPTVLLIVVLAHNPAAWGIALSAIIPSVSQAILGLCGLSMAIHSILQTPSKNATVAAKGIFSHGGKGDLQLPAHRKETPAPSALKV